MPGSATTRPANAASSMPAPMQAPWRWTVVRSATAWTARPGWRASRTANAVAPSATEPNSWRSPPEENDGPRPRRSTDGIDGSAAATPRASTSWSRSAVSTALCTSGRSSSTSSPRSERVETTQRRSARGRHRSRDATGQPVEVRSAPEQHPVRRRLGDDGLPGRQPGARAQECRQRQRGAGLGGHRLLDPRRRRPHPGRGRVVGVGERDVDGIEQGGGHEVGLGDEDDDGRHHPQPRRGGRNGGVVGTLVQDQEERLGSREHRPLGSVGARSREVGQVADVHDRKPTLGDHDGSGALGDLRGDGPDRRPRRAATLPGERGRVRRGRRPRSLRPRRHRPGRAGGVGWARPARSHLVRGLVPPPASRPTGGSRSTLSRPEDVDALPAVFEAEVPASTSDDPPWAAVAALVAARPTAEVVERAVLLGLPVAAVGEPAAPFAANGTARVPGGRDAPSSTRRRPLRPLGRSTPRRLPGGHRRRRRQGRGRASTRRRPAWRPRRSSTCSTRAKRSVALDLRGAVGRRQLGELVARADVVVTSGRAPRRRRPRPRSRRLPRRGERPGVGGDHRPRVVVGPGRLRGRCRRRGRARGVAPRGR